MRPPDWVTDPDAVLQRRAEARRAAAPYASGCADFVGTLFTLLALVGLAGGVVYALRMW